MPSIFKQLKVDVDSELGSWAICIAVVLTAVAFIYPALSLIIRKLQERIEHKKTQGVARVMRVNPPAEPGIVRVRQTDLVGAMSPADRLQHTRAEQLFVQGQVREAAAIFESIRFQRRAVDVLEAAKLVDEACAVLLRLNVPMRAAIVYERNGYIEAAIQHFLLAEDFTNAARLYLSLAQKDFRYFQEAAANYVKAGKPDAALNAYAAILDSESIVKLCLDGGHLVFLANYMQGRRVIADAFALIPVDKIPFICAALGETPRAMALLASWTESAAAQPALLEILRFASTREDLCRLFAASLSASSSDVLQKNLERLVLPSDQVSRLDLALRRRQAGTSKLKTAKEKATA